jgi:hypothetical protein
MPERKSILLRLDPAVHDALARWAAAELRSTNAQIEFLLRRALADAGRGIHDGPLPRRGRPRKDAAAEQAPPEDGSADDAERVDDPDRADADRAGRSEWVDGER